MKDINLTCVECPLGCDINVETDGDNVLSVKGNSCPRGDKYARDEVVCPKRVLTTTVKTDGGEMLPVKSKEPIKKEELFSAVNHLNKIVVKTPVKLGQTISNYDGVEIIACKDIN
ncbi:MAG: DUF1667 domain-containing protein [Clostridia bacterium]|nr:DUF1667 domain-containing protein [Clostridia bacterium]